MYFKNIISYVNYFVLIISYYIIFNSVIFNNIKNKNIHIDVSRNNNSNYRFVDLSNETNIININGKINKNMVDLFLHSNYVNEINGFDNKLKPIINIIIDSRGGDYYATIEFITKMEEIKKRNVKFYCYSIQASSSAFVIFQYCDNRYVSPTSLLFHHNATIKIPLETLEHFYEKYYEIVIVQHKKINRYIASKIGLSYKEYMKKIRNDWIIKGGENIMTNKLADEIVIFKYKLYK